MRSILEIIFPLISPIAIISQHFLMGLSLYLRLLIFWILVVYYLIENIVYIFVCLGNFNVLSVLYVVPDSSNETRNYRVEFILYVIVLQYFAIRPQAAFLFKYLNRSADSWPPRSTNYQSSILGNVRNNPERLPSIEYSEHYSN